MIDSFIRTPKPDDSYVQQLLDLLDAEFEPILIPLRVDRRAVMDDCILNVQRMQKEKGGAVQLGWHLAKTDLLYEAIFHAVWIDKSGQARDITPKPSVFKNSHIMFVPDDRIVYEDKVIPSRQVNYKNNGVIDDFIAFKYAKECIESTGKYEGNFLRMTAEKMFLVKKTEGHLAILSDYLGKGNNENSPCLCRSGQLYRDCHGAKRDEMLDDLIQAGRQ
ncbi:MAG: SEC-C domain-containing protein [Flavobacteriales bacterium]|nr:SEC-C domain-containing protein [Flavobacteriales bacterium]